MTQNNYDNNELEYILFIYKTPMNKQEELIARIEQAPATIKGKLISLLLVITKQ